MSHLVSINVEVRDLDALNAACRELKKSMVRAPQGQKVKGRTFAGAMVECDAYIKLDGPYDVLLNRQKDGSYKMETDFWAGSVAQEIGQGGKRLIQLYGVCKAEATARKLGHAVSRQVLKNGSINVLISGGRY